MLLSPHRLQQMFSNNSVSEEPQAKPLWRSRAEQNLQNTSTKLVWPERPGYSPCEMTSASGSTAMKFKTIS